jgi:hypothetical protein
MYYILLSSNCPCFFIFAEHIAYILQKNNIPCKLCVNTIDASTVTPDDNLIVFWNYVKLLEAYKFNNIYVYSFDTVLMVRAMNELAAIIDDIRKFNMCRKLNIINFSNNDIDRSFFQNNLHIENYHCLEYGYGEFHEKVYKQAVPEEPCEDIDVLFFGSFSEYRLPKLVALQEFCHRTGYKLVTFQHIFNELEKAKIIARSKIVVTYATGEIVMKAKTNDLCRLSFLIANKKFFICEEIGGVVDQDLKSYGVPCVPKEKIHETIEYYLSSPQSGEERKKLCDNVYERFKVDYNFEKKLLKILSYSNF